MRYAPYAALLAAAALWGANPVLGRLVGPFVPPLTLSWLRWLLVLCMLSPFVWRERREIAAALRGHWRILLPLAALANVPQSALVYKGLELPRRILTQIVEHLDATGAVDVAALRDTATDDYARRPIPT